MLDIFVRLAFVFCIILLIINVFAFVLFETAEEPVRFSDLLGRLENAPTIDLSISDSVEIFTITEEWAVLDGLRLFINALGSVLGLILWISTIAINLVIVIGYLLYMLGVSSFSAYI